MQTSAESKVRPVKLGGVNIYFLKTESGHILVDAGMPGMGRELDDVFSNLGIDPQSVQLIVATHGHLDHIGLLAHAKEVTGGRVLCHRSLTESLRKGSFEKAVMHTKNLRHRLMNFLSSLMSVAAVEPDIMMGDEFDLIEYDIAGRIIHTPGHSASSITVVLDNGEVLIGDQVREVDGGEIGIGVFYEDKQLLMESLKRVASLEPRTIFLSHGSTIDNRALRETIEAYE
jgi:glyoxylase-like metal-dependent hydrolase (beta-lactamase superfamily II)